MKSLKKNRDSIDGIRKSLLSFGKGITSATSISFGISKDLVRGNTVKKSAILSKSRLFNKRRQSVLRREREDIIEAGQVGNINNASPTKRIASSTKGLLGRIMDALGAILIGWGIVNLPRIIEGVNNLIKKIQDIIKVTRTWYENTVNWFTSLTSGLDDKLNQLRNISFDFDVDEENIKKSTTENKNIFDNMLQKLQETIDFWRNGGSSSEKPETPSQNKKTVNPKSFSGKNMGGSPNDLLKFISSAEGGYGSTYSGYLSDFSRAGEDITQMTITQLVQYQKDYLAHQREKGVPADSRSAAVGAYQMLYPEKFVKEAGLTMGDKFTPENQGKLIIAYMADRGLTAEKAAKDPVGFAKGLSQSFAGVPVVEGMQGAKQYVERGQSYYRGQGNNAATTSPEKVEEAIKQFGEKYKPNTNQSNNTVNPNLNVNIPTNKSTNLASNKTPKTIQVPIPISTPTSPPPAPRAASNQGGGTKIVSGGTSLNSFIFTELQYT